MKKSRKLLCVLLALVMVVSLLPVMAFAADEDIAAEETTAATVEEASPETESVVTENLFGKLPNYLVAVKTSDGRIAAGAQVSVYNQNKDQVATAVANYGVAIFSKKDLLNIYSVSATWTDPRTNIKYKSAVGLTWTTGLPDIDVVIVYPKTDLILNTTDHNAYIVGYPDGTVKPDGRITRAEVATILYRLMKDQVKARFDSKPTVKFSDVSSGDWYYDAVQMCAKAGIVSGYPDGSFKPNQAVTRAEFFKRSPCSTVMRSTPRSPARSSTISTVTGQKSTSTCSRSSALLRVIPTAA